jgi:hypothetical protein
VYTVDELPGRCTLLDNRFEATTNMLTSQILAPSMDGSPFDPTSMFQDKVQDSYEEGQLLPTLSPRTRSVLSKPCLLQNLHMAKIHFMTYYLVSELPKLVVSAFAFITNSALFTPEFGHGRNTFYDVLSCG